MFFSGIYSLFMSIAFGDIIITKQNKTCCNMPETLVTMHERGSNNRFISLLIEQNISGLHHFVVS